MGDEGIIRRGAGDSQEELTITMTADEVERLKTAYPEALSVSEAVRSATMDGILLRERRGATGKPGRL